MEDIKTQIENIFSQNVEKFEKEKELIFAGHAKRGLKNLIRHARPKAQETALDLLKLLSYDTSFENQIAEIEFKLNDLERNKFTIDGRDYRVDMNRVMGQFNNMIDIMDEAGIFDSIQSNYTNKPTSSSPNESSNSSEILDVFISYSTKDQEAKNELVSVFQREGITFFLDEKSLDIGKDIDDSLEDALDNTKFTVFLVSENSLKSIWVSKETIYRLLDEKETGEVSILPVLLDNKAFDEEFVFEIHDIMTAELEKQKNLRQKAAEREMDTSKYKERIDRLEFVIPKLNTIFTKLTEGLSANFFDESRKEPDLKKLVDTIKGRR